MKEIFTSKKGKQNNLCTIKSESKNIGMDFEEVKPHAKDQSNKVVANNSKSLSPESTESSNMRLFLSLQIIHITQCGTKFQTFEECFPKQFLQPASKSIILLGRNQETSKDLRAKLHNQKPHHRM